MSLASFLKQQILSKQQQQQQQQQCDSLPDDGNCTPSNEDATTNASSLSTASIASLPSACALCSMSPSYSCDDRIFVFGLSIVDDNAKVHKGKHRSSKASVSMPRISSTSTVGSDANQVLCEAELDTHCNAEHSEPTKAQQHQLLLSKDQRQQPLPLPQLQSQDHIQVLMNKGIEARTGSAPKTIVIQVQISVSAEQRVVTSATA